MSTLIAVVFDDESTAFEVRAALVKMQKQYLLEMEDAVVVTRDPDGKTKLHQAISLTGVGAAGGAFWGMLIGCCFSIHCWVRSSVPAPGLCRPNSKTSAWTTR